ncbi:MAG: glycosyltransferase family 39 protein [Firmicutes bacterium]|nr:glycosyltransferase family 39 protein [Bacillota bacterium]
MYSYRFKQSTESRGMSKSEKILLAVILLTTLAVRLYYVYTTSLPLKLTHDEVGYHKMTLQFLDRHIMGYYSDKPRAFVTPGYPLFLAGAYYIGRLLNTGPLITARVFQVMISVGSVFLVYNIASKSGGPKVGIFAAMLSAIYLPSFMANNRILTEVLYTFLQLGYIYSVIIVFEKPGLWRHALSGGLLGLAVLVRPSMAPFLVIPYIVHLVLKRDTRILAGLLAAITAFCLVMTPWWVRNYLVFDKFIMFATQTGNPLLRGTDPYDIYDRIGPSIVKNVPDSQMTRVAVQRIMEGLKTDPWLTDKWYTVGKLSFLWLRPWGVTAPWARMLHLWMFVVVGWLGTFVNIFDRHMRWPALWVVFAAVTQLVFIPIERYTYPLTPIMAIMAATLLGKIVDKALDSAYLNR